MYKNVDVTFNLIHFLPISRTPDLTLITWAKS